MPDQRKPDKISDSGKDNEKKEIRQFISAKVVRSRRTRKQLLRKLAALCAAAFLCGACAGGGFLAALKTARHFSEPSDETEAAVVSIQKDERDTAAAGAEQTEADQKMPEQEESPAGEGASTPRPAETDGASSAGAGNSSEQNSAGAVPAGQDTQEEVSALPAEEASPDHSGEAGPASVSGSDAGAGEAQLEEQIREAAQKAAGAALADYEPTASDLEALLAGLRAQIQAASGGLVIVQPVSEETDWFDNALEKTDSFAGIVITATDSEFLILTSEAAVRETDAIRVIFADETRAQARLKACDGLLSLAVVGVELSSLGEETARSVSPAVLGNSYQVRQGDLIAAVGFPAGMAGSVDYGLISCIDPAVQTVDGNLRVFFSDILSDAQKGTFFLNLRGELIGWSTGAAPGGQAPDTLTEIVGISDCKGILERLSNGKPVPYLGVRGGEVLDEMQEAGVPAGIYVEEVEADSPAYDAGIKSGDIITAAEGKSLRTMRDYESLLDGLESGQVITVEVSRKGREAYTELSFSLVVADRQRSFAADVRP